MYASVAAEVELLVAIVGAESQGDLPFAPTWFGPEGDRVLYNCTQLLEAVKAGTVVTLLNGGTIRDYLGAAWLETHAKAYEQAERVEESMRASGAT